jgi:hypothetical protein
VREVTQCPCDVATGMCSHGIRQRTARNWTESSRVNSLCRDRNFTSHYSTQALKTDSVLCSALSFFYTVSFYLFSLHYLFFLFHYFILFMCISIFTFFCVVFLFSLFLPCHLGLSVFLSACLSFVFLSFVLSSIVLRPTATFLLFHFS